MTKAEVVIKLAEIVEDVASGFENASFSKSAQSYSVYVENINNGEVIRFADHANNTGAIWVVDYEDFIMGDSITDDSNAVDLDKKGYILVESWKGSIWERYDADFLEFHVRVVDEILKIAGGE